MVGVVVGVVLVAAGVVDELLFEHAAGAAVP